MNMEGGKEMLANIGSAIAALMFIWAIIQQYFPHHLRTHLDKYSQKLFSFFYPYIQIKFNELTGERLTRNEAYFAIESYLSLNSTQQAKRLKADMFKNNQSLTLSLDDYEEVADEYEGVKVWWEVSKTVTKTPMISYNQVSDEKRYYKLSFHKKNRVLITEAYLNHVMKEGKAIKIRNRQRKMYTNNGAQWSHVMFQHPATFETLAIESEKKRKIIDDLEAFSKGEEFYARIGKAWKRGYLLYGPPGTGKSTMIAAIANRLEYDVYDLELTAVKDNTELRRLLIETSSKAVIVIEDIDCSLELTGQRSRRVEKEEEVGDEEKKKPKMVRNAKEEEGGASKVTLSGLLNFIDGLWSSCGEERLIVFTTNHVEKLDPALIRTGRMDMHIKLSYCGYEAFRILAKNYLNIESHSLFSRIERLVGEVKVTPAEVAEYLMPKTGCRDADSCLGNLVHGLELVMEKNGVDAAIEEDHEQLGTIKTT